jgi:hypothetical protein
MTIFEHVGALMSFILSLAIATVAVFLAKLVRRRRTVIWSVPHALWLTIVLLNSVLFWIDSFRVRDITSASVIMIIAILVLPLLCFLQSELVAPGDATAEDFDLKAFHERHRIEYAGATMVYGVVLAAFVCWLAAANQEPLPLPVLVFTALTLVVSAAAIWMRQTWVQVTAPLILLATKLLYLPVAVAGMASS